VTASGDARPLVLVVDDEAGIRDLLVDVLEDLGYATIAAADGEAAIAAIERERARVRLAIVDFVLPGRGGLETVRGLRAVVPGLPAIISSGFDIHDAGGISLEDAAREQGLGLLAKPYKIGVLAAAIERALE
jgi:CheY-like chemotaxis protein